MKKNILLAIAATLIASSAMAADYTASVGVVSNNVERGVSQTRDGAGIVGDFGVKFDNGLFGKYQPATVDFSDRTSIKHKIIAGYMLPSSLTGPVEVSVGTSTRLYTGGSGLGNPTDRNFTEGFVKLGYAGFTVDLNKTVDASTLNPSKNAYYHLGYASKFTLPVVGELTGSIGTGYTHYETASVTRHTTTEVSVSRALTKAVALNAGYSFGGRDVANREIPNKGFVGIAASF